MTALPGAASPFDAALVEQLVRKPSPVQQALLLYKKDLLNVAALSDLMDIIKTMAYSDPARARQLTMLFDDQSVQQLVPEVVPRALYLRAQTHIMLGELYEAHRLIEAAQAGFLAQGDSAQALRTQLGLMVILDDLGQYQAELDLGQTILDAVATDAQAAHRVIDPQTALFLSTTAHQNRGACLDVLGRYNEALDDYGLAEAGFRELGQTESIAQVISNRGMVHLGQGQCHDALGAFEIADGLFAQLDNPHSRAVNLMNIGQAQAMLGNYNLSLDALQRAGSQLAALNSVAEHAKLELDTANAYLSLNLFPEAVLTYRSAIQSFGASGVVYYMALARWGLGSALAAQAQFDEAEASLAEAASAFEASGNTPMRCSVLLEQSSLLARRGQSAQALAMARQALELVDGGAWSVEQAYALMRIADLTSSDLAQAEATLLRANGLSVALVLPQLRHRVLQRLGRVYQLQGREREAEAALEDAVTIIEQLRGTLAQENMRVSFLRDKTTAYADLVRLHLARGDEASVRRAFVIAERAKSRALVDVLVGDVETKLGGLTASDNERLLRLQKLQAELQALYNQAFDSDAESQRLFRMQAVQGQAKHLEDTIGQLRLQLPTLITAQESLFAPMSFDTLGAHLTANMTLLAYYIIDDEILAFVYRGEKLQVFRALSCVSVVEPLLQRLSMQWAQFASGADFIQRNIKLLDRSTQRVLQSLHTQIFQPLAACLTSSAADERLMIIPHGLLHHVPFHALFDGQKYLLDRFEVSYAPSATVMAMCLERKRAVSGKSLVLGVTDPRIPAVAAEVRAVAAQLTGAETFLDEEATLARFSCQSAGCDVVHIACHGFFHSDNPMFSALKLADGWLSASDVLQSDLSGALITLSACESGRSEVSSGDEIIGLTRAFLGAGATTLVVSQWLVEDNATAELMTLWYALMRSGQTRAGALRAAQRSIKTRYAHPYYWAAFVLMGQP